MTVTATALRACCVQCNAKWILNQQWSSYKSKQDQAHSTTRRAPDDSFRPAQHCQAPLFTWRGDSGSGTHVGLFTGLYLDLIVLIKSLEESIKVMQSQLERVRRHNSTRVPDGRFLFGHAIVDEARGGVFILDVSMAQPHSAAEFMVHQLAQMLEFWCAPDTHDSGTSAQQAV
jgi:hypothetical protein